MAVLSAVFGLTTRIKIIENYVQLYIALMFRTWFGVASGLERLDNGITDRNGNKAVSDLWMDLFDLSTTKAVLLICR